METTYYCDNCNARRRLPVIENSISPPVRNGLLIQTDLHRCGDQLRVYNLFVDDDANTRTVEQVEIPKLKKEKRSLIGNLPTPGKLKSETGKIKTLHVTNLDSKEGLRLILTDAVAKYKLNLGNVNSGDEKASFTLFSYLNTIELQFYPSLITPNEQTERWLHEFINIIERIPTIHLGQYVNGLSYIQRICTIEPTEQDLKVLEMLLTSSEVIISQNAAFDPGSFMDQDGGNRYESKTLTNLFKLLSKIEANPSISLSEIAETSENDLIYLCNQILILEDVGQIKVERPQEFNLEELMM